MDLYYRLNVFAINVPSLKARKPDLPLLINGFAQRAFKNMNKVYQGLHMPSLKWASHYDWPGNIRELQNWVEHSAILHQTGLFHLIPMQHPDTNHTAKNMTQEKPISLQQAETKHMEYALRYCNGRISGEKGAAELLGLPASTLRSRMKKLGLTNK